MTSGEVELGGVPFVAPAITDDSREFWTAGEHGELRIHQCPHCHTYIHPPVPVCRVCRSLDVSSVPVSGHGTLISYTVNHQPWSAQDNGPYIVGLVELDEQQGLNLITSIVDSPLADIQVGMPVVVGFHQLGEAWLPVFRRDRTSSR